MLQGTGKRIATKLFVGFYDAEEHIEYTEEAISTSLAGLLNGIKVK